MKLSHRRIKKALKKRNPLPWERVMIARGQRRLARRRDAAVKAGLTMITMYNARYQAALIASQPTHKGERSQIILNKAQAMIDLTINTAQAVTKIWEK